MSRDRARPREILLIAADLTTLAEIAKGDGDDEVAAGLAAESTDLRRRLESARVPS
jgi:hypothetical protein